MVPSSLLSDLWSLVAVGGALFLIAPLVIFVLSCLCVERTGGNWWRTGVHPSHQLSAVSGVRYLRLTRLGTGSSHCSVNREAKRRIACVGRSVSWRMGRNWRSYVTSSRDIVRVTRFATFLENVRFPIGFCCTFWRWFQIWPARLKIIKKNWPHGAFENFGIGHFLPFWSLP